MLIVDLYYSKVYAYPICSRKQILQKLEQFYTNVQSKRKNQNTQLQVDNEFQQVKIKDINDKYNVTIFATSIRAGNAFAAEQKNRELKSRISKVKTILDKSKAKIPAVTITKESAENMNDVKGEKYGIGPNDVEKTSYPVENLGHYLTLKG